VEFEVPKETENLVFLAGGTGIAPAIQAATAILTHSFPTRIGDQSIHTNGKKVHILWANRRSEDCAATVPTGAHTGAMHSSQGEGLPGQNPIVRIIEGLQERFPDDFKITYFVDEKSSFIDEAAIRESLHKIITDTSGRRQADAGSSNDLHARSSTQSRDSATDIPTQVVVSGPDGFIAALAGPKVWAGGQQQQGVLSGILGKVLTNETMDEHPANGVVTTGKFNGNSVGVYKI
jgi:cytochrome-b5 reductase